MTNRTYTRTQIETFLTCDEFLRALVEIPKMYPELKRSESLTMMASKASYNALAREILADMLYEEDTKAAQFAHGYAVGRGALPAPV